MRKQEHLSLSEQITKEITKSYNKKQAARLYYYKTNMENGALAIASWEQFKGSWAGTNWIKQHEPAINAFIETQYCRFQQIWTY